jgi:cobalamin biosynthesis Mg chelatase CobN
MRPTAFSAALALLFALGILAGCGGGSGGRTAALTGASAPTRSASLPTLPERTVTETAPAGTVTTQETRTAIVARTSTAVQTQPVTATTTTTGVSPAAAAAAGAAVATQEDSSSTQWGWIAFGILALGVIVFAIVWWIRRRHTAKPAT